MGVERSNMIITIADGIKRGLCITASFYFIATAYAIANHFAG
jgi:hypothetical protein